MWLVYVPVGTWATWLHFQLFRAVPALFAATLGTLACRALRPRPPRRRLAIQPGTAATLAATFVLLLNLVFGSVTWLLSRPVTPRLLGVGTQIGLATGNTGLAVASAWLVILSAGLWRPERSWIDRLGRLIGILWILLEIVMTATYYLQS